MIQITNRLSRGARLRRGRPLWVYALAAAVLLALAAGVILIQT